MLINLRNALMAGKRLPYDNEIEFLESTGQQYINTGVLPANNMSFDCAVMFTNLTSGDHAVLDSRSSGGTRFQMAHTYANKWTVAIGGSYDANGSAVSTNTFYQLHGEASNGQTLTLFANGSQVATLTATGGISTIPIYVLARNLGATADAYSKARIYSLKIYVNGVLVRDYIPVRKGTVGYLYDRVSGKLFGNAGTGDFQYGQDVVPVEYIESHGTEYIDTGVYGSQNLRTTFDYQLVYSGTAPLQQGLFGCYTNGMKYHLYCSDVAPSAFQVGMGSTFVNTIRVDNVRHSIEFNNSAVSIDGNAVATFEPYGTPTAHTLLLFALHNTSGGLYSMTPMRKWRVQMWDNGTPVRSFRPVRVGTEGAMMDVLTRRIYRNAGTGAFTYGNDLKYPIPAE